MVISRPLLAIADRHGSLARWRRSTTHFASISFAACQSTRTGSVGDSLGRSPSCKYGLTMNGSSGVATTCSAAGAAAPASAPQDGEPGERADDGIAANETV